MENEIKQRDIPMRKYLRKYLKLLKKNKRLRTISLVALSLLLLLIVVLIIALILKYQSSKQLTMAINEEPITLDPAYSSCADFETLTACCFEGLMKFDENGNPVCAGATSYHVSDDGLVYTFNISPDSFWSNGEKVKAQDYIYAWERAAVKERNTEYAYLFENIEIVERPLIVEEEEETEEENKENKEEKTEETNTDEITEEVEMVEVMNLEAKNDNVLVVHLVKPDSSFLSKCAMAVFSPVCQRIVEAETRIWGYTEDIFVSNGAYKLEDWEGGSYIKFSKNEFYKKANQKSPETIRVTFAQDEDENFTLFKRGDVLYSSCVSGEKIKKYENKNYFNCLDDYGTYYICFNHNIKPFNDPKVREALSLAIDRYEIAESIEDMCVNAACSLISPAFKDAQGNSIVNSFTNKIDVTSKSVKGNVEKARQLLAEAGYPDGEGFPEFNYCYNDNFHHEKVAEMIIEMWKNNLGITCTAKSLNFDKFISDRTHHNFDAVRAGSISPYNDVTTIFENFMSNSNYFYWVNDNYDSIVSRMRKTNDLSQRLTMCIKAEKYLSDEKVACPVYWYSNCYLASKRLDNFYVLPSGVAYFDNVIIR